MHRRSLIAALFVTGVVHLAVSGAADAQTLLPGAAASEYAFESFEDALRFAENSFVYGDYGDVVEALSPLLLPAAPDGVEERALVRAYTLLGTAAHFETNGPNPGEMSRIADQAFLEILLRDPRFRLDPLLYPPRVIERFETVREAHADELDELLAEENDVGIMYVEREVREQSRFVSMLPFGYGFFASEREVAGLSYAIGESALGGAMIGLFLANEIARGNDGFFEDPDRARARGTAQVAMASGFTTLVLINVLHGALTHESSRRVDFRTLTEPPPELRDDDLSSRRRRGWNVSFAPIFAPR